uniref:Uncharacterized protein n=1 Tax=Anguilla anguilla TaxID=7936 RepID=A0A0E9UQJ3_ANGAN
MSGYHPSSQGNPELPPPPPEPHTHHCTLPAPLPMLPGSERAGLLVQPCLSHP